MILAALLAPALALADEPPQAPQPEDQRSKAKLEFPTTRERAFTFYGAASSSEEGWEDVFFNPVFADYIDHFVLVAALSQSYAHYYDGRLQIEAEGQVAYDFGDQTYWEFNAVPLVLRWKHWPWSHSFDTSMAFGIGLSYTSKLSQIEVELENDSKHLLVYWMAEVTAGPHDAHWQAILRLHHRSVAYGLLGKDGGMNALGVGVRWMF